MHIDGLARLSMGRIYIQRCIPSLFYDSIYHLLTMIRSYIFKAIRLYPVSEELEEEMQRLERGLVTLWGTTSWDKRE